MLIRGFGPDGSPIPADPAWWKTLLTFAAFTVKTGFFVVLYIWVRWTLPRFRYDQVMQLGWKVMLPTALAYIMVVAASVLVLNELGMEWGFLYGLVLTGVSAICTGGFVFFLDRGRIMAGAGAGRRRLHPPRPPSAERVDGRVPAGTAGD
jgi:NADH-quinone oxidoreductase subunit H